MKTERVGENQSSLPHGIASALIGGAVGYASKYALPLTAQEKDADYRLVVNAIKKSSVKAKSDFLESIKNINSKSLVKDTFMGTHKSITAYGICAYDHALKKIRPAAPFIIAGSVSGLVISFLSKVLKTDVN